jgi:hypothetical protein
MRGDRCQMVHITLKGSHRADRTGLKPGATEQRRINPVFG